MPHSFSNESDLMHPGMRFKVVIVFRRITERLQSTDEERIKQKFFTSQVWSVLVICYVNGSGSLLFVVVCSTLRIV